MSFGDSPATGPFNFFSSIAGTVLHQSRAIAAAFAPRTRRLSLLEKQVRYSPGRTNYREIAGEEIAFPSEDGGTVVKYALTQHGVNFIQAVRLKRFSE